MATQRQITALAAAGAAVLGIGYYSSSGKRPQTQPERHRAQNKREELGTQGAGVGNNAAAGRPELQGPSRSDKDAGGDGGGGKASRGTPASSDGSQSKVPNESPGEQPGASGALKSAFGNDGTRAADDSRESGIHNTRGISKMGSEVPSKKTENNTNTV